MVVLGGGRFLMSEVPLYDECGARELLGAGGTSSLLSLQVLEGP